jgi:hypothetical protein
VSGDTQERLSNFGDIDFTSFETGSNHNLRYSSEVDLDSIGQWLSSSFTITLCPGSVKESCFRQEIPIHGRFYWSKAKE